MMYKCVCNESFMFHFRIFEPLKWIRVILNKFYFRISMKIYFTNVLFLVLNTEKKLIRQKRQLYWIFRPVRSPDISGLRVLSHSFRFFIRCIFFCFESFCLFIMNLSLIFRFRLSFSIICIVSFF